ncbi:MAG: 2Fe-2S iron-sulfur cluster-binding protein [Slackia sp.]
MVENMEKGACCVRSDASKVSVTIDGIEASVPRSATVLEAARIAGVDIPTLCYLELYNEIGACRICLVEVEGIDHLVAACNSPVFDGMKIRTDTQRVRSSRKMNLSSSSRATTVAVPCAKRNMPSSGARRHHGHPRGFLQDLIRRISC